MPIKKSMVFLPQVFWCGALNHTNLMDLLCLLVELSFFWQSNDTRMLIHVIIFCVIFFPPLKPWTSPSSLGCLVCIIPFESKQGYYQCWVGIWFLITISYGYLKKSEFEKSCRLPLIFKTLNEPLWLSWKNQWILCMVIWIFQNFKNHDYISIQGIWFLINKVIDF